MSDWSRRRLLACLGTTLGIQTAGCLSDSGPSEGDSTDEPPAVGFESLLTHLPVTDDVAHPSVYATDVTAMNGLNRPLDSFAERFGLRALDGRADAVTRAVGFRSESVESHYVSAFEGELSPPDRERETRETAAGRTYEFYDRTFDVVAVRDGVSIVADSEPLLEAAFAANRGDEPGYADRYTISTVVTDALPDADLVAGVQPTDGFFADPEAPVLQDSSLSGADVSRFVSTVAVEGPDTLESSFRVTFTDPDLITEDHRESIAEFAAILEPSTGAGTVTVEGDSVVVSETVDLADRRIAEGLVSPRLDAVTAIGSDRIEIAVNTPDEQFPVDTLTLRVAGNRYDRAIWTQGRETISSGDTVVVATEDIEPLDEVTLVHEHEEGSSSSRVTLSAFEFEHSYDRPADEVTLTYQDPVPLDGDRLFLVIYEYNVGPTGERLLSTQPWRGETLTTGDTVLVDEHVGTNMIHVCWDGETPEDSLYAVKPVEEG